MGEKGRGGNGRGGKWRGGEGGEEYRYFLQYTLSTAIYDILTLSFYLCTLMVDVILPPSLNTADTKF